MCDPEALEPCYKYVDNLRKWLSTYENNPESYSFSEEHGYVAYPYNLIIKELDTYINDSKRNDFITASLIDHLKINMSDRKGSFSSVVSRISQISREHSN